MGDAIVGKSVPEALTLLSVMLKRGASPMHKLLTSAAANAKIKGLSADTLIVKRVAVDAGPTLKRTMPRARGSAARINKRTSRILIELGVSSIKVPKSKVQSVKSESVS